ncbi:fimbrin [Tieghemiomyces parasiticus]|uniref:Fimbrin n=1 Tax=Tieghemiomyces parasiticus TaxID=78921 RepID=A0A9W8DMM2_9FUNG|nr:fimbrin [Tieghemiomyces parasiticus]
MSSAADIQRISRKYPKLKPWDIEALVQEFNTFNLDSNGALDQRDLVKACQRVEKDKDYDQIRSAIRDINLNSARGVEVEEFVEIVANLRTGSARSENAFGGLHNKKTITVKGSNANTAHSINEDEKAEFVHHINQVLAGDSDVGTRLPIDPNNMQVFDECRDGLLLSKLINDAAPGTIDERVLNRGKKLSPFQVIENNNLVVNSAKAIGCSVVNIGSQDLIEGREHLILGLIWQIIKIGLLAKIDIKLHPELYRLLEEDETLEQFLKLPADAILLRWFNYHLKAANWHRRVNNFSSDVKDGENYTVLLNQLVPAECSRAPLQEPDLFRRAEQVLENADRIGCRRYLTPKTLVAGNSKLNLAFVAHLFNTHPGLEPLTEEAERAELDDWLFNSANEREARAFALWLNSLGVDPFINNLFEDLKDGLALLQAVDKVAPGKVNWRRVNRNAPQSRFKQVENTNYAVDLGKEMRFSLVGIQGADITDGVPTLILAFTWQLMRAHVVQTLKSLSKNGREVTDSDMIQWANDCAKRNGSSNKSSGSIASFKDSSLRSGLFLIDVLNGLKPGVVDYSMVTRGASDDDAKLNAKYAISIARKLGATIFLLPEDIVEVKPKMILTFIGSLMALDKSGQLNQQH